MAGPGTIDVGDEVRRGLLCNATLVVHVRAVGARRFAARLKVGFWLVRLGARLIGVGRVRVVFGPPMEGEPCSSACKSPSG